MEEKVTPSEYLVIPGDSGTRTYLPKRYRARSTIFTSGTIGSLMRER